MVNYWLAKQEPSGPRGYHILDLKKDKTTVWDGIHNNLALKHMKNAKILLDSSPFHPIGLHERFLYGAMSGAAIASDQNHIKEQIFENKMDAVLYNHENLNTLGDDLRNMIADGSWKDIALGGQRKVKDSHTWKHRTQAIVEAFNLR